MTLVQAGVRPAFAPATHLLRLIEIIYWRQQQPEFLRKPVLGSKCPRTV